MHARQGMKVTFKLVKKTQFDRATLDSEGTWASFFSLRIYLEQYQRQRGDDQRKARGRNEGQRAGSDRVPTAELKELARDQRGRDPSRSSGRREEC